MLSHAQWRNVAWDWAGKGGRCAVRQLGVSARCLPCPSRATLIPGSFLWLRGKLAISNKHIYLCYTDSISSSKNQMCCLATASFSPHLLHPLDYGLSSCDLPKKGSLAQGYERPRCNLTTEVNLTIVVQRLPKAEYLGPESWLHKLAVMPKTRQNYLTSQSTRL